MCGVCRRAWNGKCVSCADKTRCLQVVCKVVWFGVVLPGLEDLSGVCPAAAVFGFSGCCNVCVCRCSLAINSAVLRLQRVQQNWVSVPHPAGSVCACHARADMPSGSTPLGQGEDWVRERICMSVAGCFHSDGIQLSWRWGLRRGAESPASCQFLFVCHSVALTVVYSHMCVCMNSTKVAVEQGVSNSTSLRACHASCEQGQNGWALLMRMSLLMRMWALLMRPAE
jgi:hypothetical protein